MRCVGGEQDPGRRRAGRGPGVPVRGGGAGAPRRGRLCAGGCTPRPASRGTHLCAGRAGSAARALGSQRPRLCGLRWAPLEAEPRRRRRCTAAFRFLSRRRPAARAQPWEPGAAASQEQRARPAPPRARPTCSEGRDRSASPRPSPTPAPVSPHRRHAHSHTHACTLMHTQTPGTNLTHTHSFTHS